MSSIKSGLKLKIASDIHLEYYKGYEYITKHFELDSDTILVLAGDVGKPSLPSYREFLAWVASRCRYVILVAGNHEYWHSKKVWSHVVPLIKERVNGLTNICFLHNSSITIEGIKFIGSTLWSNASLDSYVVEKIMGDYYSIKTKINNRKYGITVNTTHGWRLKGPRFKEAASNSGKVHQRRTIKVQKG